MLPGGRTVVTFCERILALGRWNLQKSLGANARGFPGVNLPGWLLISALLPVFISS